MAKIYVKVNNGLQQENFNSYKHESIYIKKILNDKPRLLKTGLAKKSTHSASCPFNPMKNLSKAH